MAFTAEELAQQASANTVARSFKNTDEISLEDYTKKCRNFIIAHQSTNTTREHNSDQLRSETHKLIELFVDSTFKKEIKVSDHASTTYEDMKILLKNVLTEYDAITEILNKPNVNEIQLNGFDKIFYEEDGIMKRLRPGFKDKETYEKIIFKLNHDDGQRLNMEQPFITTRSREGHRVALAHKSVVESDDYIAIIRKQSSRKFSNADLLKHKTIPEQAWWLLKAIPQMEYNWLTAGPTFSGKTKTNGAMIDQIKKQRVVFIENPAEFKPSLENFVQFQSRTPSDGEDSPNFPSSKNLLHFSLRCSPVWIIPGEIRTDEECRMLLEAAMTGHYVTSTLHARGVEETLLRYHSGVAAVSNESENLIMRKLCLYFKFVIVQERLNDGSRKITEIAEITGSNGTNPEYNTIFRYDSDGYDENGLAIGKHVRINAVTEKTYRAMLKAGVKKEVAAFLFRQPSPDEVLTYYEEDGFTSDEQVSDVKTEQEGGTN
jgi:pilus assembly protein CpaF